MINLDDTQKFAEIDPQGMTQHVVNFPQQVEDAWALAQGLDLPAAYRQVRQIVIAGMGGSAIGGDLLRALVADACPLPIHVHRGYGLPAFAQGEETLVIVSSYSGNTEETLSAFEAALSRGTRLVALTTGGRLRERCRQEGVPLFTFDYAAQPRAALGYSFIPLVAVLSQLGFIEDPGEAVAEAVGVMRAWQEEIGPEVPLARNPAKRLAGQLMERVPVVYGAELLAPVARRWKGQFNENAKGWAFYEELPELNHNAVVGYERSEVVQPWVVVLLLRSAYDSPRVQRRWEVTRELLLRYGVNHDVVWARGESRLAQMLSIIHFGDFVSLYLALASGVDPTPVEPIVHLKAELARG
ncbi:MAG TPA: bifunctional phosphoglucose/phosphomannose isomerase [Chloroflexi bacterium]|nr:bifunctional phosphoglucose/phosphomannose isomerase [Chloroflexota bacterium]